MFWLRKQFSKKPNALPLRLPKSLSRRFPLSLPLDSPKTPQKTKTSLKAYPKTKIHPNFGTLLWNYQE